MTNHDPRDRGPEVPRSEPEIIPPERNGGRKRAGNVWIRIDERDGIRRVHIAQPSPFSIVVGLVVAGLIVAGLFLLLAGLILVWIPVIVFAILFALLYGSFRHYRRRLQDWWDGK